jgi:hypothetical protein
MQEEGMLWNAMGMTTDAFHVERTPCTLEGTEWQCTWKMAEFAPEFCM